MGAITVRATVSAASTSTAPSSPEAGSTTRWSGPAIMRTQCGAMSPMKPITPVVAVTAPTAQAVTRMARRLTRSTSTPSSAACDSPSAMALSGAASRSEATQAASTMLPTSSTALQRAPPRLPSSQNCRLRSCSSVAITLR